MSTLTSTGDLLPPALPLLGSGKVRDLYGIDKDTLLFIATDRISAYDAVLKNGIPGKGRLLTLLTAHWMRLISERLPAIKTHYVSLDLPSSIPSSSRAALQDRAMIVRKCRILPLECIIRGYVTGSAWTEYKTKGTVHDIQLPPGLKECQAIPGGPLFTPSTKAPPGEHDLNISPQRAKELIGEKHVQQIEEVALAIYKMASQYAEERGIIIADTKFEFGLDEEGQIVLVDEVITPDSSRFWDLKRYHFGRGQDSFDKQALRDWLVGQGLKGRDGVAMPEEVVSATKQKYEEAYKRLVGSSVDT